MRAVVQHAYGAASVLRPEVVADPEPRAGWSVVRLRAAALNWHDVLVREGRYASPLPHVPGADGAGVDTATGAEVVILPSLDWGDRDEAPAPGWEILGDRRPGTYAELVAVPSECVLPKPAGLTWAQAAAVPLIGVTTYRALISRGRLRAGESLLVLGAGGGVATTAVALGTALGARVFVTSSSPAKIEQAQGLGAAGGVLYTDPSWPERARALAGDFDLVLDPVGAWADALRVLRPGGRLVTLGALRAEQAELDIRSFYFGQYDLLGTTMGSVRDLRPLLDLIAAGRMPPPTVDRTFPLEQTADAHEYLESGRAFGKIVLEIGS